MLSQKEIGEIRAVMTEFIRMDRNFTASLVCWDCGGIFSMNLSLAMAEAVLTAPRYCDGCLAERAETKEEAGE